MASGGMGVGLGRGVSVGVAVGISVGVGGISVGVDVKVGADVAVASTRVAVAVGAGALVLGKTNANITPRTTNMPITAQRNGNDFLPMGFSAIVRLQGVEIVRMRTCAIIHPG